MERWLFWFIILYTLFAAAVMLATGFGMGGSDARETLGHLLGIVILIGVGLLIILLFRWLERS